MNIYNWTEIGDVPERPVANILSLAREGYGGDRQAEILAAS